VRRYKTSAEGSREERQASSRVRRDAGCEGVWRAVVVDLDGLGQDSWERTGSLVGSGLVLRFDDWGRLQA
jgi:hypothetical protein